ncbi:MULTISPECIES: GAF domain-containing protein [Rhizobium]|uniref:Blue-light-activated histidine kinase n=1 Tax=Rhizobium rhododendri TaxID=2506430 RepID=A0ABY8IMM9_9HYPH|nr:MULTISPECIES: GAF domain-containing protein [Rhizobium]MBZ5758296.1 GAF domain-containing protein [Rhizobium sp. VS19-DR96]MBZ5764874.1 GAF domain-containing protein [Rhizobium sp. VS19-DR129.2]MBZ5772417.1 GAF domain-containing protein [Rhizobium sp. VS19-DRK62.2]MBZ5782896.1 GAF domain-containing protein [Rhizobium sp. VS19-DR121]MBZ5800344.1 GAF domain-containing protein [Rhizobium sp. VS19-DR181]
MSDDTPIRTPFDAIDLDHLRRLEALEAYDILDTAPEPEFDDIVYIASTVCNTPVSLVSLVEADRQWFKARIGFEPGETPIDQSVCAHALTSPELLVIPDLTLDPRTRHNTLVTQSPFIRFYAGAPLIVPGGAVIGTLCVIDTVPRPEGLDENQQNLLRALARQVVAFMETRRVSHRKDELFQRQKRLAASIRNSANKNVAAQQAGRIGTFEIDIATSQVRASDEFCRIFDVPPADTHPTALFESMVVPEDRHIQSNEATRRNGAAPVEVEYRIQTANHGTRWISRHAKYQYDENGKPITMFGMVQDITSIKRDAARVQALLDLGDRLRELDDIESMALAASDLMAKALDASRAGFGLVDVAAETLMIQPEWRAPGVASLAGLHHFRDYGDFVDELKAGQTVIITDVATDPRTRHRAEALLAIGIHVLVNLPVFDHGQFKLAVFVHHDRPHDWTQQEIDFVRSFGDRMHLAIARLQAEADQDVLNREIGHRLKNTFAMVQAIASQTLRPIIEQEHVRNFERRLYALSSAHDSLITQDSDGADIGAVLMRTAETLGVTERIDVHGPSINFGPRSTLSVSLLFHELVTNAMKYGALSNEDGRVAVEWQVLESNGNRVLTMRWTESGGPPVTEPTRTGFGSRLIKRGFMGTGGVTQSYSSLGYSVEMTAALSQLQRAN